MAISKERNEQLSKFADVERSHSKRLSDEQREFELKQQDQKKKHDEHIQMMFSEAVKGESLCHVKIEKLAEQLEDVQEELMAQTSLATQLAMVVKDLRSKEAAVQNSRAAQLESDKEDLLDDAVMRQVSNAEIKRLCHQKKFLEDGLELQKQKLEEMEKSMNEQLEGLENDKEKLQTEAMQRQLAMEQAQREKKELQDQLAIFMHKQSVEIANESEEVEPEPTIAVVQHEKMIRFERLRVEQAIENREEVVRALEAEQVKVRLLEERLGAMSLDNSTTDDAKALEAEKKRADILEKSIKGFVKRASDAELKTEEMQKETEQRIMAAGAQLGEVYRSWEETHKETKALDARMTKTDRLRQEAVLKAEEASKSEQRAWAEVAELQGKIKAGPVAAELKVLVESLEVAERNYELECAAHRATEGKLELLVIELRAVRTRVSQLRTSLDKVERKNMEMSKTMRSGPFVFGKYW